MYDAICADLGWSPETLAPVADVADFIANSRSKVAANRVLLRAAEKERAPSRADVPRDDVARSGAGRAPPVSVTAPG